MQRICFVIFPGFQTMSLAAASAFEFANLTLQRPAYEVGCWSENGGLVRSSTGIGLETRALGRHRFDTVIVCGGTGIPEVTPGLLAFARRSIRVARRVASICTGAFILAEAGLLDKRRATTHWLVADELKRRYPEVIVDEDRIFTVDGAIWTSAGMAAGVDLALALVERDFGFDVAQTVARKLVVYHRRPGGQSQFSALLELAPKSDRIQNALSYAKSHLNEVINVETLAAVAHLSPRQFSRAFHAETGKTPAKAIERLRLEAARLLLEGGQHSIEEVARETGFADRERMRKAFLRGFGLPPRAIRRNAPVSEEA